VAAGELCLGLADQKDAGVAAGAEYLGAVVALGAAKILGFRQYAIAFEAERAEAADGVLVLIRLLDVAEVIRARGGDRERQRRCGANSAALDTR
jgi:hypothetical protein